MKRDLFALAAIVVLLPSLLLLGTGALLPVLTGHGPVAVVSADTPAAQLSVASALRR